MKSTIKEELEEIHLREDLINENALIMYTKNDNDIVDMKIRFIKNNKICEYTITKMTIQDYNLDLGNIVRLNSDNSAIAIFKKESDDCWDLQGLFKVKEYEFANGDFLEIEYSKYFPEKPFIYQTKKKRG